jgi:hypothetical protein
MLQLQPRLLEDLLLLLHLLLNLRDGRPCRQRGM